MNSDIILFKGSIEGIMNRLVTNENTGCGQSGLKQIDCERIAK